MVCGVCRSENPIRNNESIAQEYARLSAHIFDLQGPCCPNKDCWGSEVPVTEPGYYAQNGKTPSGTPRWRCNACRTTFAGVAAPQSRQRKPHKNRDVFMLLMNKSPLRRIAEVTELAPSTLFGKIDLIHRQAIAFSGHREQQLVQGMKFPQMYIAVDRQVHYVNWSNRKDRRNVALNAIGSADLDTGYVFGFHVNFDPALDPAAVEADAAAAGDPALFEPFRKYARVWLARDYEEAMHTSAIRRKEAKKTKAAKFDDEMAQGVSSRYDEVAAREDSEVTQNISPDVALPTSGGMQIKDQYTMHAHFHLLSVLLQNAEKVRCFMDQDTGMRAAFAGAFAQRIKDRTADGWYVCNTIGSTQHVRYQHCFFELRNKPGLLPCGYLCSHGVQAPGIGFREIASLNATPC